MRLAEGRRQSNAAKRSQMRARRRGLRLCPRLQTWGASP